MHGVVVVHRPSRARRAATRPPRSLSPAPPLSPRRAAARSRTELRPWIDEKEMVKGEKEMVKGEKSS